LNDILPYIFIYQLDKYLRRTAPPAQVA